MNRIRRLIAVLVIFTIVFTCIPAMTGEFDVHAASAKKPVKVTGLKKYATGTDYIQVQWNKIKRNKNTKGYAVYLNGKLYKRVGVKTNRYKISNLKYNTAYKVSVRAYNTYKQKQYYNSKTKKWQTKKPAKKNWRGKKTRKVTAYAYGTASATLTIKTTKKPSADKNTSGPTNGQTPNGGNNSQTATDAWFRDWEGVQDLIALPSTDNYVFQISSIKPENLTVSISNPEVAKITREVNKRKIGENAYSYIYWWIIDYLKSGKTSVTVKNYDGQVKTFNIEVLDDAPRYSYEVMFVNQPYGGLNGGIYIKTNNPKVDFSLKFYKNGKALTEVVSNLSSFADKYIDVSLDNEVSSGIFKVSGGYFKFGSISDSGNITAKIHENVYDSKGAYRGTIEAYAGNIYVKNYAEEYDTWLQSIIDKVTTATMTKQQKMRAIEKYMQEHSVYSKTVEGKSGYVYLLKEHGEPTWKREPYEYNSYSSPACLVDFGKKIGYPLHNCYNDYPSGTDGWYMTHYMAKSEEDGSYYYFCQAQSTNVVRPSDITQFNFNTHNFIKCN